MKTATRTPIILLIITFILLILIYIFSANPKKSFKIIMSTVFFLSLLFVAYHFNFLDIKTNIINSPLIERFKSEKLETGRTEIFFIHLNNMKLSIFGGSKIYNTTGYLAHNFLQEGYDLYGIFGLIILILIFLSFIIILFRLLLKSNKNVVDYLFRCTFQ